MDREKMIGSMQTSFMCILCISSYRNSGRGTKLLLLFLIYLIWKGEKGRPDSFLEQVDQLVCEETFQVCVITSLTAVSPLSLTRVP